ncbi:MAG: histidine triad nucleotide-binding protein [Planctomycetota bacterium]|nr:histidine triad nucleotide-binding protein [Planctomycetota bacterium]
MPDCVFCKIGSRELQAMVVYEDPDFIAFRDINPMAPVHVLIIPKAHYDSLEEFQAQDANLLGRMMLAATHIARQERVAERGYRLILNVGSEGGQAVRHLHVHLIGGRQLQWPPG